MSKARKIVERHLEENLTMLEQFKSVQATGLKADKAVWIAKGRVNATMVILEEMK